jgi:hypothetical protein
VQQFNIGKAMSQLASSPSALRNREAVLGVIYFDVQLHDLNACVF